MYLKSQIPDDIKEQTFVLQSLKKFPSYRILGVVSYPQYIENFTFVLKTLTKFSIKL